MLVAFAIMSLWHHSRECHIISAIYSIWAATYSQVVRHELGTKAKYASSLSPHHQHNRFTALYPGPPGSAGARRKLLDFMEQREINRGRHTDHPAERHSIRNNQCPPPPYPHFLRTGCPSCRPTNSVKALKAEWQWRMLLCCQCNSYHHN